MPPTHPFRPTDSTRGSVVPNGLAMCKIHDAAYDTNIIGIRPDHVVEVRQDVLTEIDGPMLRHGLQEMHGARILLPGRVTTTPTRPGSRSDGNSSWPREIAGSYPRLNRERLWAAASTPHRYGCAFRARCILRRGGRRASLR
jgi:hypothetical protein